MSAPLPVGEPEALTAAWLTQALGADVTDVEVQRVGTGQMGEAYRLALTGPAVDSGSVPATMIAKLPTPDPGSRDFLHNSYAIEVTFYRDLAAGLAVSVPTSYYAEMSTDPDQRGVFTLLLEDLAPADQGDQIAGCPPEVARAAVVNLAGLHAPRWADPTLLDVEGLSLATAEEAEMADAMFADAVETTLGMLGDLVSAEDAATLREVAPYAGRFLMAGHDRFTLVHGDYRLDNLLIHPDGRLWAVDWQTLTLGFGARDAAFMVTTGLSVPDRRAHERDLVGAYHQRLVDLGVDGYDAAQAWEDYRLGQFQVPVIAIFGCAFASTHTERGHRMFGAMLERGAAAIRDLEVAEALAALTPLAPQAPPAPPAPQAPQG
jgi:hypothetical protein